MSEPLMVLTSHVQGKNAQVAVFSDRLEWERVGSSVGRWTAATVTLGVSLLRGRKVETEVIPIKAITNVSTRRDGLVNSKVVVTSAGGSVEFRVSHSEARELRAALLELML